MKKLLLPVGCALALCLFGCKEKESAAPAPKECLDKQFTRRLVKTVTTRLYPGTNYVSPKSETHYFFDAQNRVDSIATGDFTRTGQKIIYLPDGNVDKIRHYHHSGAQLFISITQYAYRNGRLAKSEKYQITPANPTARWTCHFEWGDDGFIHKTWYDFQQHEKTILTHDACGNLVKSQDLVNGTNEETRLSISKFADTFSPYYLIGLDKIFPDGPYSVHNSTVNQLVHWNCADYDGSPVHNTYIYNTEGLPTQMSNRYNIVSFFYE